MTVPIGNQRINPHPCTEAEEMANWQMIENILNNFDGNIDVDNIFNQVTFVNLTWNEITNELSVTGGSVDAFTVMVSGADTTPEFLHASMKDPETYVANADMLVKAAIADPAANEKLRVFLDVSAVSGWMNTGAFVLSLVDNVSTYLSLDDLWDLILINVDIEADVEKFRLIRGLVKGDVTADDTTFPIDNVIPLAGGNDPVAGNAATEITLQNIQKEAFEDNTPITAVWDGAAWEVLLLERFRMIRGQTDGAFASTDGTFSIDALEVLGSGLDPRTDTTSAAENVTITNLYAESYADNEKVTAVYNAEANVWEALPKPGGKIRFAITETSGIDAATGNQGGPITPGTGTAKIYTFGATLGADATEGATISVENYMLADIAQFKPIFVFERAPSIWVVIAEGCQLVPEA